MSPINALKTNINLIWNKRDTDYDTHNARILSVASMCLGIAGAVAGVGLALSLRSLP